MNRPALVKDNPFGPGTTAAPPENSAATKALNRADQAILQLAALNRFDLIDQHIETIQLVQKRKWRME